MKYLMLDTADREALLEGLEGTADFLASSFRDLSTAEAARGGPEGTFSPVEQCWHLADLEQEGFGTRIRRLLAERSPLLPDFDGARVARERDYRSRDLAAGIAAFRTARAENLDRLRALTAEEWTRRGVQEGVGELALCDIPSQMAQHDAAHRGEIAAWTRAREAEP